MPRPRHRVCLQDGLKLDLNQLARQGFIKFGDDIGARRISWSSSYQGEIARGVISAGITNPDHAWFRLAIGSFAQQITLVSRPRHFGGRQWFFVCPVTGGSCSGSRLEPHVSAAGKPGDGASRMHRNFWIETVALITDNQKSIHGCVRLAGSTPKIGISRRSRSGCAGRRTIALNKNSIAMKISWTAG